MLKVRKIRPELAYDLRHTILRPHQPFEACIYDADHDHDAFHVGAFYQDKLIGIASFYHENNPDFPFELQYRLRAMATMKEYRKLGAGRTAINFAENVIKEQGAVLLWCKGRTSVQEYYKKLGFETYGDVFDYPPIGPHIVMYKKIK
ncbi:GNAT family N-acetyltransferase [Virgibacillus profundi]|uniref:GNAT family N-acetyltransferase n=2 Tax=Virgibacillus profundi TaxID=2024555 RepID=A0A2A2IBQ9_9BACI|nr:GNAT family N-acetyltransferase [Virgibacillus profundi]PXY53170.1 N-acetyltransferase [Virgibacillus profundi]